MPMLSSRSMASRVSKIVRSSIRVRPPCDAFVMRFAPTTWQVERGEIVLKAAKGNPWRFEEQDATTWQRVPATADPVLLVRK